MSGSGSKPALAALFGHVRFTPGCDQIADMVFRQLRADFVAKVGGLAGEPNSSISEAGLPFRLPSLASARRYFVTLPASRGTRSYEWRWLGHHFGKAA